MRKGNSSHFSLSTVIFILAAGLVFGYVRSLSRQEKNADEDARRTESTSTSLRLSEELERKRRESFARNIEELNDERRVVPGQSERISEDLESSIGPLELHPADGYDAEGEASEPQKPIED